MAFNGVRTQKLREGNTIHSHSLFVTHHPQEAVESHWCHLKPSCAMSKATHTRHCGLCWMLSVWLSYKNMQSI